MMVTPFIVMVLLFLSQNALLWTGEIYLPAGVVASVKLVVILSLGSAIILDHK